MNDPHVKTLWYKIKHSATVSYDGAAALEFRASDFSGRIENNVLTIDMHHHVSSVEDARLRVEEFLNRWRLSVDLNGNVDDIDFEFERAELVDRQPQPGVVHAPFLVNENKIFPPTLVRHDPYPAPPTGLRVSLAVEEMWARYRRYQNGRTTLADTANYCLTVLEREAGGRRADAATKYGIDKQVLSDVGRLCSKHGGDEARKADGAARDFTAAERKWLIAAVRLMIRRAAEIAFDPTAAAISVSLPLPKP